MKKIALLLLVVALVLSLCVFVGCGGKGNDTDTDSSNNGNVNTDTDTDAQTPEEDEDLQAAYEYIKQTYKTLGTTATNFELVKNAPIGDKMFPITWSVSNEAITITETEDGNFYVVNIPALGDDAINYTLSFSVQNDAGEKKEGSFNLTIPKFSVNTHDEYVAAADGESLIIQGIVTGVISKSTNSTKENSLFIQDISGKGGYYAYNLAEDPAGKISVGMTVEVRGNKKNYNGTYELTSPVATIIDSTIKTVTPVDITETLLAASGLDAAELTNKNGMLVTIKGVTLLEYLESNGYHYFTIGNHKTYLRVSSSSNCITKDEGATLTANFIKNFYNGADVTGLIAIYNGDMYLMPVSVNPFTNIVELEKPANVKADTALDNTKLPGIIQTAGNTTLPTTFSGFSDVTIAWELTASDYATLNGNTLAITIPESAQTITLKATATCGDYSNSKDFTITVKPISTITIEEANNIGMNMAHNTYTEELYYIVGTVDSIADTFHGNMFIAEGEYSIYVYGLYDATGAVKYGNMETKPLVKDTIKVLSSVGKYSNDVQLKNAKVVDHVIHPDNEGVVDEYTQMTITEALAAEDNTKVKVSGTVVSIDTVWNESYGNICVTIADANGNKLYVYRLSTKVEVGDIITVKGTITTYNDKKQIAQGGTATIDGHDSSYDYVEMTITEALASADNTNVIVVGTVSKIDKAYDSYYNNISVYIVDEDGNELYIYRLAGDVAVGKTIKVTGSMTTYSGNRQLVGGTYVEYTEPEEEDTCEEHTFVNGVCSVCGATEHEHDYEASVTAPTCSAAGYTTYTCKVPGCNDSYTEAGEAATGEHADNNSDYKCDGCSKAMLPADGSTLTIAQALAIGATQAHNTYTTEKYYVTGTITEVYGTQYGNLYITDGTNTITVYGLYKDGTRYDAMTVKPVAGDTITVYGVIGQYNGTQQFKNAELSSHTAHTCVGGAEASCTTAQTCTICGTTLVAALGHNFTGSTCDRCGVAKPSEGSTTTTKVDLNTITSTNTSYTQVTTTSGWVAENAAVFKGGETDASPTFKLIGTADDRGLALNGKTSNIGKLTSTTLSGGISKLTFTYGNVFKESNGVDITINIKQNGEVVATKKLDNNSVTQYTAYDFEWTLDTVIEGNFVIEIVNNCPSNNSSSNKDRVVICNIEWTSAPAK